MFTAPTRRPLEVGNDFQRQVCARGQVLDRAHKDDVGTQDMDGDSRFLYVGMENRVRELDARVLFSVVAAAANFQVILGPRQFFYANATALPRGIFSFKTLNKLDAFVMESVAKLGHTPVAWDEEGPGQILPDIYLKGIDDNAVARAGRIFAWGDHQAKMLSRKYPGAKSNIQAIGNPRWDLLRPEYRKYFAPEADAIRDRYGRFILVNTNFSSYNAVVKIAEIADQVGAFMKDDELDQKILSDITEFEKQSFDFCVQMLPALSAGFPEHTIIVRPHPTEDHDRWKDLVAPFSNVRTVYEGTVVPWMLAAEAVVQNSCTTGVEAVTLGKPVVSFCKNDSALQEWHLSNHVCPRVRSEEELVDRLRHFIADPTAFSGLQAAGRRVLAKHISRLEGETSSAAIVKSLGFFAIKSEKQGVGFDREFALKEPLRSFPMNKYHRLKLPPVSAADLAEKVNRISRLHPNVPILNISHLAESCFYFRR